MKIMRAFGMKPKFVGHFHSNERKAFLRSQGRYVKDLCARDVRRSDETVSGRPLEEGRAEGDTQEGAALAVLMQSIEFGATKEWQGSWGSA